jgi:hypothetical protein
MSSPEAIDPTQVEYSDILDLLGDAVQMEACHACPLNPSSFVFRGTAPALAELAAEPCDRAIRVTMYQDRYADDASMYAISVDRIDECCDIHNIWEGRFGWGYDGGLFDAELLTFTRDYLRQLFSATVFSSAEARRFAGINQQDVESMRIADEPHSSKPLGQRPRRRASPLNRPLNRYDANRP